MHDDEVLPIGDTCPDCGEPLDTINEMLCHFIIEALTDMAEAQRIAEGILARGYWERATGNIPTDRIQFGIRKHLLAFHTAIYTVTLDAVPLVHDTLGIRVSSDDDTSEERLRERLADIHTEPETMEELVTGFIELGERMENARKELDLWMLKQSMSAPQPKKRR